MKMAAALLGWRSEKPSRAAAPSADGINLIIL
jgi:hypothetical protein